MTELFVLSITGDAFLTSAPARRVEERMRDLARSIGLLYRPQAVRLDIYKMNRTIPLADIESLLVFASDHSLQRTTHRRGEEHLGAGLEQGDSDANDP